MGVHRLINTGTLTENVDLRSMSNKLNRESVRPILKWAGGKTQLLPELRREIPHDYNKYIEPFIGGGALFFDQCPERAVISDINPELINLYKSISDMPEEVLRRLAQHKNDKDYFYEIRSLHWEDMEPEDAAARMIFLNRTCFNGLYRVNKKGIFNVPYGKYANPRIVDADNLLAASRALANTEIELGSYKDVLSRKAFPGDFIFLDPPYIPASTSSDFKRYNKEQFYMEDHQELARELTRLNELGCYFVLTNSDTPLVHDLYRDFHVRVVATRRNISASAASRSSRDVIVTNMNQLNDTL